MVSARTLEQNYQRGPSQLKGNYPELGHREANISLYIWILGEFWYGLLGRGCQTAIQVGLFLLIAGTGRAQTIDSIPTAYCTLSYGGLPSYNQLEGKVTAPNPGSKSMAQFVLEAFALANANNGLMDPQSQSAVVTALSLIQAMWVPALLNFKSYFADASVSDFNAVEFATESLVQIPYRFPHLLAMYGPVNQPGTIENLLAALLSEGQIGAINHHFTVGYTNQWMFRLCNLILTGQGVTDGSGNVLLAANADVLNRGRTDFMAWASNVREDGVREFMSPTYAGLDLEASGYLDLYARDTGISAMAQQAYKLFWIDLYANWYNRGQRMGGTHSRTYEFLVDQDKRATAFSMRPVTQSSRYRRAGRFCSTPEAMGIGAGRILSPMSYHLPATCRFSTAPTLPPAGREPYCVASPATAIMIPTTCTGKITWPIPPAQEG